ncbi:MAG: ROK family protein, partial [Bacteroidaceae bacterium]|nr:ROK family protein [Bacteroidaceae bacterium]
MKIGVDLGGTNVRAALVDGTTVVRKEKAPCPAKGTQEEVIEAIAALIEPLVCEGVTSIGMG